jgi:hypothetical protein
MSKEHPIALAPELAPSAGSFPAANQKGGAALPAHRDGQCCAMKRWSGWSASEGQSFPQGGNPVPSPSAPGAGRSSPSTIPKAIRGPRPQASLTAGVHHHPTPDADIQLFKYDDLRLSVTDGKANPAAPPWPSAGAEMPESTCSTPRQGRSWPSKASGRKRRYPADLGSDHPLLKQAYQNQ